MAQLNGKCTEHSDVIKQLAGLSRGLSDHLKEHEMSIQREALRLRRWAVVLAIIMPLATLIGGVVGGWLASKL